MEIKKYESFELNEGWKTNLAGALTALSLSIGNVSADNTNIGKTVKDTTVSTISDGISKDDVEEIQANLDTIISTIDTVLYSKECGCGEKDTMFLKSIMDDIESMRKEPNYDSKVDKADNIIASINAFLATSETHKNLGENLIKHMQNTKGVIRGAYDYKMTKKDLVTIKEMIRDYKSSSDTFNTFAMILVGILLSILIIMLISVLIENLDIDIRMPRVSIPKISPEFKADISKFFDSHTIKKFDEYEEVNEGFFGTSLKILVAVSVLSMFLAGNESEELAKEVVSGIDTKVDPDILKTDEIKAKIDAKTANLEKTVKEKTKKYLDSTTVLVSNKLNGMLDIKGKGNQDNVLAIAKDKFDNPDKAIDDIINTVSKKFDVEGTINKWLK